MLKKVENRYSLQMYRQDQIFYWLPDDVKFLLFSKILKQSEPISCLYLCSVDLFTQKFLLSSTCMDRNFVTSLRNKEVLEAQRSKQHNLRRFDFRASSVGWTK